MNIKQCTSWCIGETIILVPVASLALPVDIIEAYFEFRNMYESLHLLFGGKTKNPSGKSCERIESCVMSLIDN